MGERLLYTEGLGVHYGGVVAVEDADIWIGPGELVGLIGPNGAGKTTTVDALSGFTAHSGRVVLDGHDLTAQPPHGRARAGLARTWQSVELFEDLTVRQHCEVAAHRVGFRDLFADSLRRRRLRSDTAVLEALAAMGIEDVADERPSELSHGTQKLVGVARALAARPKVLLLDEPAAGLDSAESAQFGSRLRAVVDGGMSALLIDHDTQLVMDVCDRVYVLDFGSVIAEGPPEQIRDDSLVIEAYLGVGAQRRADAAASTAGSAAPATDAAGPAPGGEPA
jgi:branched-chain amino acid transport system ATP-binding protein